MDDEHLQATIEIVLQMIECDKIAHYSNEDNSKENDDYLKELTKVIKTVYQTVSNLKA